MPARPKHTLNLKNYLKELCGVFSQIQATDSSGAALDPQAAAERAIKEISACRNKEAKVIIIGNGGSASIASHVAVDLWKNGGVRAISFSDPALLTCVSNDFGYAHVFSKPIGMFAKKYDLLIAISSSGKSENILQAVAAARLKKCRVITLSGFAVGNPLSKRGDLNFYVPCGSYGYVETAHSALCHFMVDRVIS